MAREPALDGLPRLLPNPPPLSLKAREHSSLALKRIFDQINSSGSDRHRLDLTADGSRMFPPRDSVHGPSFREISAHGASADVDLRLAPGTLQETRNFLCDNRSLQSGVGAASKSQGRRLNYEQESSLASSQSIRCASLEPSKRPGIDRIKANKPEQEPTIDPSAKRAVFNLQPSSMQESNQRAARSSSPALSFQTQQSDASDHSLGCGFLRHIQENMQTSRTMARQKSSTPSYIANSRQSTAQLTIFYSGMVHVYDNVPAEKAHAIMLLAGDGNSSNARFVNAPSLGVPSSGGAAGTSATREMVGVHRIPAGFSKAAVSASSFSGKMKQRLVQRSDAELPFARKASLARFLEKRKDRVQVKASFSTDENAMEKEDEEVSDQPASPKRLCSRPGSPSPSLPHELGN